MEHSIEPMSDGTTRRRFLQAAGATAAGAGVVSGGTGLGAAQSDGFDGWFDNVSNYDGVVDATGQDSVTVEVGTEANGGAFGFSPAAVRVSPGATVVWEWTGNGGTHNVQANDGSYQSEMTDAEGHRFERTFDTEGVSKYLCAPHESLGMKGAIVVGSSEAAGGGAEASSSGGGTDVGDLLTGLLAGIVLTVLMLLPVSELRNRRAQQE